MITYTDLQNLLSKCSTADHQLRSVTDFIESKSEKFSTQMSQIAQVMATPEEYVTPGDLLADFQSTMATSFGTESNEIINIGDYYGNFTELCYEIALEGIDMTETSKVSLINMSTGVANDVPIDDLFKMANDQMALAIVNVESLKALGSEYFDGTVNAAKSFVDRMKLKFTELAGAAQNQAAYMHDLLNSNLDMSIKVKAVLSAIGIGDGTNETYTGLTVTNDISDMTGVAPARAWLSNAKDTVVQGAEDAKTFIQQTASVIGAVSAKAFAWCKTKVVGFIDKIKSHLTNNPVDIDFNGKKGNGAIGTCGFNFNWDYYANNEDLVALYEKLKEDQFTVFVVPGAVVYLWKKVLTAGTGTIYGTIRWILVDAEKVDYFYQLGAYRELEDFGTLIETCRFNNIPTTDYGFFQNIKAGKRLFTGWLMTILGKTNQTIDTECASMTARFCSPLTKLPSDTITNLDFAKELIQTADTHPNLDGTMSWPIGAFTGEPVDTDLTAGNLLYTLLFAFSELFNDAETDPVNSFIPYYRAGAIDNDTYSLLSDTENIKNAGNAIKTVAVVIGSVVVAAVAIKALPKLKRAAMSARLKYEGLQYSMSEKLASGTPLTRADFKSMRKAKRRMNRLAMFSSGISSGVSETMASFSLNTSDLDNIAGLIVDQHE